MSSFSIRDIITKILDGNIRIPSFQRGFVWDPDSVAFLMDSIYKGYPFGTIQLWRTKEPLRTEKTLGPFELFERDPDYPIDYVLDGQQRITSIFGVFQTSLKLPENAYNPFNIYFDFKARADFQESQFLALEDSVVIKERHFPLNALFDTVKYRQFTQGLFDGDVVKIDNMQSRFKEVQIPYQILETNDKQKVAIVFERINRKGVPLDTFQLLSAWTWSEEFDLKDKFEELKDELKPYGFENVGSDINLLLRICSAILALDASAKSLIELNGSNVRNRFDEILNGIKGSIDFIRNNLNVQKLENLPYDNLLVPLSMFFSNKGDTHYHYNDTQREKIGKWFWKTCFSRRYSAGLLRALNNDIEEMAKLKNKKDSDLDNFTATVKSDFFKSNQFIMNTVNTKTFILLLSKLKPRSFISGSYVSLDNVLKDYNRNEFHHLYPKLFLSKNNNSDYLENCLANFCFLSKADNNQISGLAPSKYKENLPQNVKDILDSALCDESLFKDDYKTFVETRAEKLTKFANSLL